MNVQNSNTQLILNPVPFDPNAPHGVLTGGTFVDVDPLDEAIVDAGPIIEVDTHESRLETNAPSEVLTGGTLVDAGMINEVDTHESRLETNIGSLAALLDRNESEHLRTRWNAIQGQFVDEPRVAVQQADALVSEVVEKITRMFADEHGSLESQWKEGNDVSTEDLRKALQHYRSFFNRLVV